MNSDHSTLEELILRPKACNLPAAELQPEPNACLLHNRNRFWGGENGERHRGRMRRGTGGHIARNIADVRSSAKKFGVSKSRRTYGCNLNERFSVVIR